MVEQVNLRRDSNQISLEGNRNGTYTVKLSLGLESRYIGTLQPADHFGNAGTFFLQAVREASSPENEFARSELLPLNKSTVQVQVDCD